MFLSNMSKSRRLTSTFFPTIFFPFYSALEKKLRILEKIRQELPPVPDIKLEPISEEVLQMHVVLFYSSATAEVNE